MKSLTLTALSLAAPLAPAATAFVPTPAEAELRAVNHAQVQAYITSDQGALAGLVDEDFRFTGRSGDWLDKAGFVELGRQRPAMNDISYDDVRVRVFGQVALVHGVIVYRGSNGAPGKTRYTDVYRRDAHRWQLVSAQLTEVADPSAAGLNHREVPAHARWEGHEPAGSDEEMLRELNAGYVRAFLESDVAWYAEHVAPDYLAVFGDGSFHDKSSLLQGAAAPVTAFKAFPTVKVSIRRFGDVALIHAENPFERHDGRKGVNRYTDIWHKRDGRWVCIAAHVTKHKLPA